MGTDAFTGSAAMRYLLAPFWRDAFRVASLGELSLLGEYSVRLLLLNCIVLFSEADLAQGSFALSTFLLLCPLRVALASVFACPRLAWAAPVVLGPLQCKSIL